jgi:ubiquitin-conjugating enzyme E2 T
MWEFHRDSCTIQRRNTVVVVVGFFFVCFGGRSVSAKNSAGASPHGGRCAPAAVLMSSVLTVRLSHELRTLQEEGGSGGVWAWSKDDRLDLLEARIEGPRGSPYEGGTFELEVRVPDRYPFAPPNVKFITRVWHPNIDPNGRICLDILSMPPKGHWTPSLNILTVLRCIQVLLTNPNADDPLNMDAAEEFKHNHARFLEHAREYTQKYAVPSNLSSTTAKPAAAESLVSPAPPLLPPVSDRSANLDPTLSGAESPLSSAPPVSDKSANFHSTPVAMTEKRKAENANGLVSPPDPVSKRPVKAARRTS